MSFTPEWIIGHCTATPPHLDIASDWVDRVHRQRGFFNGTGYHGIIRRDGFLETHEKGFKCRPLTSPGAHVGGCGRKWNRITLGLSLVGGVDEKGHPEDNYTPDQLDTFVATIREWQDRFNIPDERVIGHRDLIKMTNAAPKACPCMSVQSLIKGHRFGNTFDFSRTTGKIDKLSVPTTHKVRRGESLWGVSKSYGISLQDLALWNNIQDVDHVTIGKTLKLRPPQ